ncbi:metal tolerance protein 9 [Octopus sinensis]|uniref:Metal tolerance protein 9 n=1 Tax=Octopus sinensis TaxID=2607531 RepID=A0A7E6EJT2_9MOLL|nr:metal tolerance protein 9 [Octopus sinensis]
MPLHEFIAKRQPNIKKLPKRLRSYYKAQNKLITSYEKLSSFSDRDPYEVYPNTDKSSKAGFYARLILCLNVCLTIGKAVAVSVSGSISIISSLVDSCVDLISGIIFWWTTRAMKRRNPYTYPQGRTKLEPVSIIMLSVIMSFAALQLILQSVQKIVAFIKHSHNIPSVDFEAIGILLSTIVIKLGLYIACRRVNSPTVQALALDQRNDVVSNFSALLFGYIGSKEIFERTNIQELRYLDPIGAILISSYFFVNWWRTGYTHIKQLTGYTAKPVFLSKITWLTLNHNRKIKQIDTVRAFYFGINFLVEVDIVLPENMTLKEAHDIGESLQQKLECLPEVERAFVHLDYEVTHNPKSEHKIV